MIRRGHLLIIFFFVFMCSVTGLSYERRCLDEAMRQKEKIDTAFRYGTECAAKALRDHVYEKGADTLVKETFNYAFSLALGQTEMTDIVGNSTYVERITYSINGHMTEPADLKNIKDEDSLEIYISLEDICIKAGNRIFVISRNAAVSVRQEQ
ncbi:MAG: hypothetical protein IKS11_07135 [Lachnospiraceae bacterium]|nr:hypothetical protein [Lachnospiraceae bacterium]